MTVRAETKDALHARTAAQREALIARPECERLLVVYGDTGAELYVEQSDGPARPDKGSRSS